MALSEKAKAIKQVPDGFSCSLKGYRKLVDFVKEEYLDCYKDYEDQDIKDMIRIENRLARSQH